VVVKAHGDHARIEMNVRRQFWRARERFQVLLDPLAPSRKRLAFRLHPAGPLEDVNRYAIHVESPRREHAHVAPAPDARSGSSAGFEDNRCQLPSERMCSGGQSGRACADDHDGNDEDDIERLRSMTAG
jgi:hypothetical protein